jgi:predicted  nucleic acid-binding Zn-ribbon protein
MPPVNPSSTPEVDNEATAELPVLDVAAYESTLNQPVARTDTWVMPANGVTQVVEAKATTPDAIPTLNPVDLEGTMEMPHRVEFSGTHEMPSLPPFRKSDKVSAAVPVAARPAAKPALAPTTPATAPVAPAAAAPPAPRQSTGSTGSFAVPPSPPLIEELRNALAAAERRIQELTERARIADAERGVAVDRANAEAAQLREQLGLQFEKLSSARERLEVQRTDEPELHDELFRRYDQINELQLEIARQSRALNERDAQLDASVKRGELLDAEIVNLRAGIARRDGQIAILEADLVARSQREHTLNQKLSDALASADPNTPDLRGEIAARDEQIRRLTAELRNTQALAADKNDDLQVAEESIRHLEAEVRDKAGKLEEASVTVEEWRAVIAESQRSILQRDGRIQQLEHDLDKRITATAIADSAAQTGEEVALEGPARVLIRTDGNTDFVHVLGRRTRIGRGNDNEVVLDTKHVSRYHAVLLAGPVHTSIEDLNSTNGVFVNGRRVARQVLKDGDRVTVGRTHFRYTVRD